MKKVLVTFVLALTTCALAQGNTQQQPPAQQPSGQQPSAQQPPQPGAEPSQANIPTSQKVIKDPAEYNAYITALNTQDPGQKAAAMEAFVKQYPNSVVKLEALEQAMAAYQQVQNPAKVEEIATQIRQIDPNNVRALAIITAIKQAQNPSTPQQFTDLRQLGEQGLKALPSWPKPTGMSDADYDKFKTQMEGIFAGAAAFGAVKTNDYAAAQQYYEQALKAEPTNLTNLYWFAVAKLESKPMDLTGFWYGAHAIALAQAQNPPNTAAANSMKPYLTSKYQRYHGGIDGWDQIVASAAQGTAPPAGFTVKPAPTLCDLAANAVQQNGAEGLSFADRETILSCRDKSPANKTAADAVWQNLQTLQKNGEAKLKIPAVKIIAVPDNNTLQVAVSEDNQKANKADMKVEMEKPMTKLPAVGSMTDIIGVISDYTPDPFMFTMTKGALPTKAPAKRAPARRRTRRH